MSLVHLMYSLNKDTPHLLFSSGTASIYTFAVSATFVFRAELVLNIALLSEFSPVTIANIITNINVNPVGYYIGFQKSHYHICVPCEIVFRSQLVIGPEHPCDMNQMI